MKQLDGDFDYIVVGAGAAGCIMANRDDRGKDSGHVFAERTVTRERQ